VVVNSNGTIINWGSFSIGSGESVYFQQSSASSSVLNRVLSGNPSEILGNLSSNGKVWLINPAGIMVGAGARIDVAGFVASTLNVSNQNFLAGKLLFDATPDAASVVNKGVITTPSGGSVYLVGTGVINEGLITTPKGETLLAAGQTVSLVDTGTPGVKVEITGSEGEATNLGTILAEAGRIGLAGVLVRNSGTLNASSVVNEGGRIFLRASQDAYVDGNGRIVTTGTKGGRVEVLGERVAVMDHASIDASGVQGGGEVLIGGDYQGKNPDIPNSRVTYFGKDASIRADATGNGDGGKVILWADDTTRAYGSISAQGGSLGGNGGFVETSGHDFLDVSGIRVNTLAALGVTGSWLLDPTDITISHGAVGSASFSAGVFDNGGGSSSALADGDINNALLTTNVTVTTASSGGGSGDITLQAGVAIANGGSAAQSLTLTAGRYINFGDGATTGTISINSGVGLNLYLDSQSGIFTKTGTTLNLVGGASSSNGLLVQIQNGKTWQNDGTVNLSGYSQVHLWDGSNTATFLNNGVFNTSSTAGWFFYTNGASNEGGVITNNGTFNVNVGGSIEAEFDQGSSGILSIANGQTLSMQNAGVVQGVVNTNSSGTLWISEHHRGTGDIAFTNTTFNGSGTLKIDLTSAAGTNGNYNGISFSNAHASTLGSIILNTNGGNLSLSNGSSLTAGTSLTANVGNLSVNGSWLISNGTMNLASDSYLTVQGQSGGLAAGIRSSGNQTITASSGITVQGASDGSNGSAVIESLSGTQTISTNALAVYGGGTNPSGTYNGNYARISANGTQVINVTGANGIIRIEGGGNGASYGGHDNYAQIRQNAVGGSQQISYTDSGGVLHVYGGQNGYSNQAEIDAGLGSLTLGDASHRPDIELRGGNSGGTLGYENSARIGLDDVSTGTLTIYGQNLSIYGGAADHGGAGLGAKTQRIDLSQDLYMIGGSSSSLDEDGIPDSKAYIGSKYGADIRINTGGGVTLYGGTVSPVLIGSLTGTASIYIETAPSSGMTIQSDSNGGGGVFLGSLAELASNADARSSELLSNDILMGSQTQLISGGDAVVTSSYGKVGMGYLKVYAGAGYGATISAYGSILDQNGVGINVEADSIDVQSTNGGQMDGLAISLDTKVTNSSGSLTAIVGVPDSFSQPLFGGISIRNTDTVGFGTGSGYISLRDYSLSGGVGAGSNQLRVYFQNSADLTLNKVNIGGGSTTGDLIVESGGNLSIGSGYWGRDATNLTLKAAGTFSVGTEGSVENSSGNLSVQANNVVLSGAYLYANGQLSLTATQDVTVNNHSDIESAGAMTVNARNIAVSGASFFSAGVYDQTAVNANFNVSGNLSLTGSSYIEAGDDVRIQLSGQSSTLSLSDHSYVLSDAITQVPATTHVTFASATSGGIYLDGALTSTTTVGQSGFYVLDTNTPALPGSGLDLVYAPATTAATNPVVPTIDKLNKDITTNTLLSSSSSLIPQTGVGTTSSSDSGHTVGGEPGTFGGSEKQDQGNEKEQNNAKPKQKNYCS